MALRKRWGAWLTGLQWGLGHTAGVGVISLLVWWLREALPLERISSISEQIVGVVLIGIGLWTLRAALKHRIHIHDHEHDGNRHLHMHLHRSADGHDSPPAHEHSHAPVWVGVLHGAAGSAHLLAVLPALALPSRAEAVSYLVGYGLGTIGAMVAFSSALGLLAKRVGTRDGTRFRKILSVAGGIAVVVGLFWLIP